LYLQPFDSHMAVMGHHMCNPTGHVTL